MTTRVLLSSEAVGDGWGADATQAGGGVAAGTTIFKMGEMMALGLADWQS